MSNFKIYDQILNIEKENISNEESNYIVSKINKIYNRDIQKLDIEDNYINISFKDIENGILSLVIEKQGIDYYISGYYQGDSIKKFEKLNKTIECIRRIGLLEFLSFFNDRKINSNESYLNTFVSLNDNILEDFSSTSTSAAIGPASSTPAATTSSMGGIVSANPSINPGSLNGSDWSNGGGTTGTDLSFGLNNTISAGGKKYRKGKKVGKRKVRGGLRNNTFSLNQDYTTNKKVMTYNDFIKKNINKP